MDAQPHVSINNHPEQDLPAGRLWALLREGSRGAHEGLDRRIMAGRPFADLQRYGLFLQMQLDLHAAVSPLYQDAGLGRLLPDLAARDRKAAVLADMADLGVAPDPRGPRAPRRRPDPGDLPEALGWLYVAEGSNLGAAFLLKTARKLGLSESHGARHMAPAAVGRGRRWRDFTAALDAIPLEVTQELRAVAGARAAFDFVYGRAGALFPAALAPEGPRLARG